ncbi:FAD-dependent thymidylate synthase [Aliarcobacter cryaerophilus]|uniref:FAD-dependent thymidylate synthase n=1 Tax=Aliarcobacter cryaerophilus TaxID=28198 RepID=UPI0021B6B621|nr:FAD-dependent thymidylate synthase [Aliarcobacter cryaerophilus]MCT7528769.1 FAD-dependent thymidylate synthase [Aliarcobacter cryaerophilus]
MKVKLLSHSPLEVADIAICKCYGNEPHSDIEKVKARINRVANVSKHSSTIEHIVYSFDIDGISRACLTELARHRIASYTVKSSRYTLQELKKEHKFLDECFVPDYERISKYVVLTDNDKVNFYIAESLESLRWLLANENITNDLAKYNMIEAYKTSLVMTINARSLQNFLELRSSKHALWEIQNLAKAMYEATPDDHKFLYENIFKTNN